MQTKKDQFDKIKAECQNLQDMVLVGDIEECDSQTDKQILVSTINIWRAINKLEGKKVKYNGIDEP